MTKAADKPKPWIANVRIPTGWDISEPKGCPASAVTGLYRTFVEGQADIRLSDLRIDGQPVDLGPSCRTSRPVDIDMWGEPGYAALEGGSLGQYRGMPFGTGTRSPLQTPGYPTRNGSIYFENEGRTLPPAKGVDAPPFTGCGATEDLAPLVTAMASGPDNPLTAEQGRPLLDGAFDLSDLARCNASNQCALPVPEAPDRPTPPNSP